jgi:hypothetical protein
MTSTLPLRPTASESSIIVTAKDGNRQHAPFADEVPEAECLVIAGTVTGNTTLLQYQTTIPRDWAVSVSVKERAIPPIRRVSHHACGRLCCAHRLSTSARAGWRWRRSSRHERTLVARRNRHHRAWRHQ